MLSYYLLRAGEWLVQRLPLGLSYWVADRAAWVAYYVGTSRRRVLVSNLGHVLGANATDSRKRNVAMGVLRVWVRNSVDFLRLPMLTASELERLVAVHGWENTETSLLPGKGRIFTSIHFGTPDVAIQILGIRGLRPVVLHEKLEPPKLYEYISGIRACQGLTFVPVGDPSVLKLVFRTLRAGGAVGLAADRDVTESGRDVTFFGAPARLPDGHVSLARRTGAPIFMTFCRRLPDDTFSITIEPPFTVDQTVNAEADIDAGMRKVVAAMERAIGANPEQWVYFHPVWLDWQAKRDAI